MCSNWLNLFNYLKKIYKNMKNYKEKDGMLMIFRAAIITVILLLVSFAAYRIYKHKVEVEVQNTQRNLEELEDVIFCTGPTGTIYRIK